MGTKLLSEIIFIISSFLQCTHSYVTFKEQLEHVANRVLESRLGIPSDAEFPSRRADFHFDPHSAAGIVGAPSRPSHLPEAEAILPGHTLIRPAMGMLKSSIKFPHRELENGFGVNGNINSLGIRYDGRNERVLYSGFRRMPSDYIMVVPKKSDDGSNRPSFETASVVLDLDKKLKTRNNILDQLKQMKTPAKKNLILYLVDFPERSVNSKKRKRKSGNQVYREPSGNMFSEIIQHTDVSHDQYKRSEIKKENEKSIKDVWQIIKKLYDDGQANFNRIMDEIYEYIFKKKKEEKKS